MAQSSFDIGSLAREIEESIRALKTRRVDPIRDVRKEYSKRIADADPADVIALTLRLIAIGEFTFRWVAYELIASHKAALRSLDESTLLQLGQGLDRWEAVDTFAPYLSGPAWREGQISDAVIHGWAHSEDRWWRRAALVSTVALNIKARGGRGDVPRTLDVCRPLVQDRDDMVVKAMSWALRAASQYDAQAVRDFLDEHQASLAPRVIREVNTKLKTGLKNKRRDKFQDKTAE